ncbi:hypothetical protein [Flavobacterium cerinum]|uniref:Uncharacterized protein n=1 Tax=Flavobacterium cerinum TaxID=2502784 RepID=A0A3S3R0L6_9FLAO|nr:hypothetical protein [Flavobacterium cerinum]RWX00803.1 hypothetical protein EPI11_07215 [Flavobacterium cerinum]
MSYSNFYIKNKDHFVLFVELKDKIVFDSELSKNNIPYHIDDNQSNLENSIRYFFLDENQTLVDKIVIDNGIIASTGSIRIRDYNDQKKVVKLYGSIAVIIAVTIVFMILFLD